MWVVYETEWVMAYLRMVSMLKALIVSILIVWLSLLASSAMMIAASSARLIVHPPSHMQILWQILKRS